MRSVSYFLVPFSNAFFKVRCTMQPKSGKKSLLFSVFFLKEKTYFYQAVNCLKFLSEKRS